MTAADAAIMTVADAAAAPDSNGETLVVYVFLREASASRFFVALRAHRILLCTRIAFFYPGYCNVLRMRVAGVVRQ